MADKLFPLGDGVSFKRYNDMGDGTHAEVVSISGGAATPSVANTFVMFGDSFMQNQGVYPGNTLWNDRSFVQWANAGNKLKGRLRLVRNAGISGNTTDQMLSRMNADVKPYPARFLFLEGGINDYAAGKTNAQIAANMETLVQRAINMGYIVALFTVGPTASANALTAQLRDEYIQIAAKYKQCLVVDMYSVMIDPASGTGALKANFSVDGLHPSAYAARTIGAELETCISSMVFGSDLRVASQANAVANYGATATQILPNPLLVTATGGTISGTGATGVPPSDYTCRTVSGSPTVTSVWSVVPRADGYGNDIQVVASAAQASSGVEFLTASHHADVSVGDVLTGEFSMSVSGASGAVKGITLYVDIADANGTVSYAAIQQSDTAFDSADISDFIFRTIPITVAAGCTNLRLRGKVTFVGPASAGTFKFGRLAIRRAAP